MFAQSDEVWGVVHLICYTPYLFTPHIYHPMSTFTPPKYTPCTQVPCLKTWGGDSWVLLSCPPYINYYSSIISNKFQDSTLMCHARHILYKFYFRDRHNFSRFSLSIELLSHLPPPIPRDLSPYTLPHGKNRTR